MDGRINKSVWCFTCFICPGSNVFVCQQKNSQCCSGCFLSSPQESDWISEKKKGERQKQFENLSTFYPLIFVLPLTLMKWLRFCMDGIFVLSFSDVLHLLSKTFDSFFFFHLIPARQHNLQLRLITKHFKTLCGTHDTVGARLHLNLSEWSREMEDEPIQAPVLLEENWFFARPASIKQYFFLLFLLLFDEYFSARWWSDLKIDS